MHACGNRLQCSLVGIASEFANSAFAVPSVEGELKVEILEFKSVSILLPLSTDCLNLDQIALNLVDITTLVISLTWEARNDTNTAGSARSGMHRVTNASHQVMYAHWGQSKTPWKRWRGRKRNDAFLIIRKRSISKTYWCGQGLKKLFCKFAAGLLSPSDAEFTIVHMLYNKYILRNVLVYSIAVNFSSCAVF